MYITEQGAAGSCRAEARQARSLQEKAAWRAAWGWVESPTCKFFKTRPNHSCDDVARPISKRRDKSHREASEPRAGHWSCLSPHWRRLRCLRHRHRTPRRLNRARADRWHLCYVGKSEITVRNFRL